MKDYEDDPFQGDHKIAQPTSPEVSTDGGIEW